MGANRFYRSALEHDDLAGIKLTNESSTYRVERTGLVCDNVLTVLTLTVADRVKTVLISNGYHLLRRHKNEAKTALKSVHSARHCILDGRRGKALLGNDAGDDLCVNGGVEDVSRKLKLTLKLCRIRKLTRGCDSESALYVVNDEGLCVYSVLCAERAVSYVAESHIALTERRNSAVIKNVLNKSRVLVDRENSVVVNDDARALLPSVL